MVTGVVVRNIRITRLIRTLEKNFKTEGKTLLFLDTTQKKSTVKSEVVTYFDAARAEQTSGDAVEQPLSIL